MKTSGDCVTTTSLDVLRIRFYAVPLCLRLTLGSGKFQTVSVNTKTHALRIEQPPKVANIGEFHLTIKGASEERDAWSDPLSGNTTRVQLTDAAK